MDRPLIGITLDWEREGSFSKHPYYALREHYFSAIYQAGGLPLAIPHIIDAIPEYLNSIKGLLVPGGEFAAPQEWYVASTEPFPYQPSPRTPFDRAIVTQALERDMPILGICAGMQFLGCISGCKMTRNIHSYLNTKINHWNGQPTDKPAHDVQATEGTLFAGIVGTVPYGINSHHQEALVEMGAGVTVNAVAPDGAIEGIELQGKRFALGLQWHPEYVVSSKDKDVFTAFVAAAREYS